MYLPPACRAPPPVHDLLIWHDLSVWVLMLLAHTSPQCLGHHVLVWAHLYLPIFCRAPPWCAVVYLVPAAHITMFGDRPVVSVHLPPAEHPPAHALVILYSAQTLLLCSWLDHVLSVTRVPTHLLPAEHPPGVHLTGPGSAHPAWRPPEAHAPGEGIRESMSR
jgi:hypothetical protein